MRALQYLSDFYNYNTLREWMTAAIVAVVVFVVGIALRGLLVKRIGAIAERTTTHVDDMAVELIAKTRAWVIAVFALMSGVAQLTLPPRIELVLGPFGKLVFLWQTALWGAAAIAFWVKHYSMNRTASNDRASVTMISAIGVAAKVMLWTLIVLGALEWSLRPARHDAHHGPRHRRHRDRARRAEHFGRRPRLALDRVRQAVRRGRLHRRGRRDGRRRAHRPQDDARS